MKKLALSLLLIYSTGVIQIAAQEKTPIKFGEVSMNDFNIKQSFDSNANAVIIADVGKSYFVGNNKGGFSLVFKIQRRIKILNRIGFDAANIRVKLYNDGFTEDRLSEIKAVTYNIEEGQLEETTLDKKDVFKEKLEKNYFLEKLVLPDVKAGSIIEYSYTITSNYQSHLQSWIFQDQYPCLWCEYEVDIPSFFHYINIVQGLEQPTLFKRNYTSRFNVGLSEGMGRSQSITITSQVYNFHWVMKNLAPLKEENYVSSNLNYVTRIDFQLAGVQYENEKYIDKLGDWQLLAQGLMKDQFFGEPLTQNNRWLNKEIKMALNAATNKLEKARRLFAYVRDNFTCTGQSGLYVETTLKEVMKKHSGTEAELNLLLIAMFKNENLLSNPVILSTTKNGRVSEAYPILQRFNYVVAKLELDGQIYYLDASEPFNGFGRLSPDCYNGHAREITSTGALPVYFYSDSLKEQKIITVDIKYSTNGFFSGFYKSSLGYNESDILRKSVSKNGELAFIKTINSRYPFDIDLKNPLIDNLGNKDIPVTINYNLEFKPTENDSTIYFPLLLGDACARNPFLPSERKYPVNMPFALDETYVLNLDIPDGYEVALMPKSARVSLNEGVGFFEYLIQSNGNEVHFRNRIKIDKTIFNIEDYKSLRDFYAFIVNKQAEMIVLKKKSHP
jgi:hypothetical protein